MPERHHVTRPPVVHRPGPLAVSLGVVRMLGVVLLAAAGALVVPIAALLPFRIRGVRPSVGAAVVLARVFLALCGVRLRCPEADQIRAHRGVVFLNHLSYLDPVVVMAVTPVRFLSTAGVRRLPFIGWIARAVGTVFVDRGDESSRASSRVTLVDTLRRQPYPPVAVAPEGQIGPGDHVLPFRHGAFEIARDAGVPVLPIVLRFDPYTWAVWQEGEWILHAVWRLVARTTPFRAEVHPLEPFLVPPEAGVEGAARRLEATYDDALADAPLST